MGMDQWLSGRQICCNGLKQDDDMIRLSQITMPVGHSMEALFKRCAKLLKLSTQDIKELRIVKQSIDARKKPDIVYSYVIDIVCDKEAKVLKQSRLKQAELIKREVYRFPEGGQKELKNPIVIIGMGPAGLFCGYMLAKHGYKPVLLERGEDVDARTAKVQQFWASGVLDTDSNVQFGEGGAGTFSDGKLNTLIKDKDGRNREVLSILVENGAPEHILYDAKPHIGTDVLSQVVKNMRKRILEWGGEVHFKSQVTDFVIEEQEDGQPGGKSDCHYGTSRRINGVRLKDGRRIPCQGVVLAIGHSARDTFQTLYESGVPMASKAFAVGFRVEHPQYLINESQYGVINHPQLGAAPYKVVAKTSTGRGVYSFCMCPGGYVVNASSEEGRTAVNGMSYAARDSANANSAIIVAVTPEDFGSNHPLAGVAFQRKLEEKAYELGHGRIPVEQYGRFKEKVTGQTTDKRLPEYAPCIKGSFVESDLTGILTEDMNRAFIEGMEHFERIIPGFASYNVWMDGVESRTSSPVRIMRDETYQSEVKGLYPCGEGAGYAGGITSAAMDGLRVAEEIAGEYCPVNVTKYTQESNV